MPTTISVPKHEIEDTMPQWVKADIEPVRELYHASLTWRAEMFAASDNIDAQNRIRAFARDWDIGRHTITLAEAERRWHKANLRQNALNFPFRWKSDDERGTWLTTTYIMEHCFGPEPQ